MPCVVFGTYMASPFDFAWVLLKSGYRSEGITPEEISQMEMARLAQMRAMGEGTPMHSLSQGEAQAPFQHLAPHLDPITGEVMEMPEEDPMGAAMGEEQFDLQTNNPGIRPSQTGEARSMREITSREARGAAQRKLAPKLDARAQRRQQLGRN